MFVGVYKIELHIPASRSLKAKRSVVNSLKAKLGQIPVHVAEVADQDLWQSVVLGASAVSSEPGYLDNLSDRIEQVCLREHRAQLLRVHHHVFPAGFDLEY